MSTSEKVVTWPDVLALAKELLQEIRDRTPKQAVEVQTAHALILGMFWRAVRLYQGILLLLEAHLPEEAAILARSLFEESLRLCQLASDERNRNTLILCWANASIGEKIGLIKTAESLSLESDVRPVLVALEDERSKLQGYAQRHGVTRLIPFLSTKDAALRFGRRDDYWTYQWSHESVHGSDAAWLFARHKVSTDTVALFDKTDDPRLLVIVAVFAAISLAEAAHSASTIFGWQSSVAVKSLLEKIKHTADTYAG
jgi:hypothetical protein